MGGFDVKNSLDPGQVELPELPILRPDAERQEGGGGGRSTKWKGGRTRVNTRAREFVCSTEQDVKIGSRNARNL